MRERRKVELTELTEEELLPELLECGVAESAHSSVTISISRSDHRASLLTLY